VKNFNTRIFFVMIIALFLVTGSTIVVGPSVTEDSDNKISMQTQVEITPSYSVHDPIVITHDDNFTTEGFTGGGTWNNPYVLDGVSITTNGYCISISHTRAVFLIENCLLTSTSEQTGRGVYLNNATDGSVESSIITGKDNGVYLISSSNNCTFINNSIYNNADSGVRNWGAYNVTLTNNTIYGHSYYGFYTASGDCTLNNNTIHDNENSGVFLDDNTYNITLTNNTIFSNKYGIFADQSYSHTFVNNTIKDNWYFGVHLQFNDMCTFVNNTFVNNGISLSDFDEDGWYHNFTDNTVNGKPLGYFWNSTDIILDGDLYGLVILANCTNITVRDGSINNSSTGILVGYSPNCTLVNNTLYNHTGQGIRVRLSDNCTLVNNTIYSCETGISVYNSDNCTITNNTLHSMTNRGIFLTQLDCAVLANNTIRNNQEYGVYAYDANNQTITDNIIHDNYERGFYFSSTSNCDVISNEFLNNGVYGIQFAFGSSNNMVYDNLLAWNTPGNAVDNGIANYWDDGISIGNTWSAYDGVGTYTVPGTAGSIDHYPQQVDSTDPVFTSTPDDVQYGEEQTGPTLTWEAVDDHPVSYSVLKDGLPVSSLNFDDEGVWNTSSITISLEHDIWYGLGLHNITLIIVDGCYNTANDTVQITVVDQTPPTIDHPDDIEEEVFEGDHAYCQIIWNASDSNPTTYEILKDGSVVQTGDYDIFHVIVLSADGLSVGTYNYTCVVYDVGGNWVSDTVIVTITPMDTTTTTTDTDTTSVTPTGIDPQITMILLIGGLAGVIVVVVLVVVIRRR